MAASILPTYSDVDQYPPDRWGTTPLARTRTGNLAARDAGTGTTLVLGTDDPMLDLALLRFVPAFIQQAGPVVICVHPRLIRLVRALDSSITVVAASPCLEAGRHISLAELPRLLYSGMDAQAMDRLPCLHVPYGAADACHAAVNRQAQGRPVIGLFGGDGPHDETAWQVLAAIPGISWVGPEIVQAAGRLGLPCADYFDQAALLDCLDLVATADLGIALLAEGLGKEVWWLGDPLQVKRHLRKVDSAFPSLKLLPAAGGSGLAAIGQAVRTWYNQFYERILAGIAVPADLAS